MKLVIVLSCVVVLASAFINDGKIVGGQEASIQDFPYQLSLQQSSHFIFITIWSHICGASIVSVHAAVTAAHCVNEFQSVAPKKFRLQCGSGVRDEGISHAIKSIKVHSQYDKPTSNMDAAIIFIEDNFIYSDSVQPIPLAETEPEENAVAIVSGWGTLKSGGSLPKKLQSVEVPIVSRGACQDYYGVSSITDNMICAGLPEGGKDSCQGDSGGPLVVNKKLVGIVSWGYGCAEPGHPGVYTNVAALLGWINKNVQDAILNK